MFRAISVGKGEDIAQVEAFLAVVRCEHGRVKWRVREVGGREVGNTSEPERREKGKIAFLE